MLLTFSPRNTMIMILNFARGFLNPILQKIIISLRDLRRIREILDYR